MRKICKFIALSLLFFNFCGFAEAGVFRDVQTENSNQTAIDFLHELEIVAGYVDGNFKPEGKVNRVELLKILIESKNLDKEIEGYGNCFPDVLEQWFAPYVCYAKEKGWVKGYQNGYFRPGNAVSKVEALKMMVNVFGIEVYTTPDAPVYEDTEYSAWYYPYVKTMHRLGFLEETGVRFFPAEEITRGGASENIFRMLVLEKTKARRYKKDLNANLPEVERQFLSQQARVESEGVLVPIEKVVDGDTVDVLYQGEKVRVRISGINTPETVDFQEGVQCFGPEASARAKELLEGREVWLETNGELGKYGRLIGYLRLESGEDFGEKMIEEGFAWNYDTYPHERMKIYEQAEVVARENLSGLWASEVCGGLEMSVDEVGAPWVCSKNVYNCTDFVTRSEAQEVFDYCWGVVGKDVHKMDQDGDGEVCEGME